jgi:hypothetical protein
MVRPTLPARSVAPMTATLFGAKMASSGCRSLRKTPVGTVFCGIEVMFCLSPKSFTTYAARGARYKISYSCWSKQVIARQQALGVNTPHHWYQMDFGE